MDRETDGASQLVTVGTAATVPLRRLGTLLRDARLTAGDDITDIVGRCDGRFDVIDIRAIEAGEYRLTDEEVGDLLAIYGADPGDLLASRSTLVIDLDEGTVAAGNWTTSFAPETDGPDDILARYLALLYEMRGLEPGTPIPLRTLDVSVLSEALAMPARAVEQRLEILMVPGNRTLDRARRLLDRRILVPAAGLVVAATAVGVLLFSPSAAEPSVGAEIGRAVGTETQSVVGGPDTDTGVEVAPPGVVTDPEIGDGLTVERDDVEFAPPGVDTEPEIGEGLTIERSDIEP